MKRPAAFMRFEVEPLVHGDGDHDDVKMLLRLPKCIQPATDNDEIIFLKKLGSKDEDERFSYG